MLNARTALDIKAPLLGAYVRSDDLLALRLAARELKLVPSQPSKAQLGGQVRTRYRGRGMEFEEVRHYQAGDDIRAIDWRVTARTQVTHTKLFTEERERPVIVAIDQRASMFFGSSHCFKSVIAAHCGALLGWTALANNDRIGGLVFSDEQELDIRPKRNRKSLLALLNAMVSRNHALSSPLVERSTTLSQRLIDMRRIVKPGSTLFLISDFHDFDERCEEQLYHIARHSDINLLSVSDPLELQLPSDLLLSITNGQKKRQLDTRDKQLRQHYQEHAQAMQTRLQQTAAKLRMPLLQITTARAPLEQLQSIYGRIKSRSGGAS